MGNQQGKVSEQNMAWLAGFLDGEGCLDLQKSYAPGIRNDRWRPRIRVSNTHLDTLPVVCDILTSMEAGHHICWHDPVGGQRKKAWTVEVTGMKRAHCFLTAITPYLHTKRHQAEMLIDFVNSRLEGNNQKSLYTENETKLINLIKGVR